MKIGTGTVDDKYCSQRQKLDIKMNKLPYDKAWINHRKLYFEISYNWNTIQILSYTIILWPIIQLSEKVGWAIPADSVLQKQYDFYLQKHIKIPTCICFCT